MFSGAENASYSQYLERHDDSSRQLRIFPTKLDSNRFSVTECTYDYKILLTEKQKQIVYEQEKTQQQDDNFSSNVESSPSSSKEKQCITCYDKMKKPDDKVVLLPPPCPNELKRKPRFSVITLKESIYSEDCGKVSNQHCHNRQGRFIVKSVIGTIASSENDVNETTIVNNFAQPESATTTVQRVIQRSMSESKNVYQSNQMLKSILKHPRSNSLCQPDDIYDHETNDLSSPPNYMFGKKRVSFSETVTENLYKPVRESYLCGKNSQGTSKKESVKNQKIKNPAFDVNTKHLQYYRQFSNSDFSTAIPEHETSFESQSETELSSDSDDWIQVDKGGGRKRHFKVGCVSSNDDYSDESGFESLPSSVESGHNDNFFTNNLMFCTSLSSTIISSRNAKEINQVMQRLLDMVVLNEGLFELYHH
ncbi:hypothetical protein GJ496_005038 [Pomphorhynchus laevis]|nr:hypothetical protein GJ496_005038 [Pomphorhynchus laevis]